MKKLLSLGFLTVALATVAMTSTTSYAQDASRPHATVQVVKSTPDVTVHTLMAPASVFSVTSHIIEFKSQLFVIDGQFFAPFAADLKAYTTKLGKPVTRFYISHEHPDHYLGMGDAFPDVTVYALPGVRRHIEKDGPVQIAKWTAKLGAKMVAQRLTLPVRDAASGQEVVEGVTLEFVQLQDHEADEALVIKLPELGIYIAQDLLYNGVHLWLPGATEGWRKALKGLQAETAYTTFLVGHGQPTDGRVIVQNLAYLDTVDRIRSSATNAADYKSQLLQAYPDLAGAALLDIYLPLAYPAKQ